MGGAVPSIRQPVRGLSQHSLFAVEQLSTFVIAKPNMLSLRRRNLPSHVLLERPKVGHAGAVPETPWAPLSSRSEEHTSELQSLMRISYAVFCLKKQKKKQHQ